MHLHCSCSQWCRPPSITAPKMWPQACGHPSPVCSPTLLRPFAISCAHRHSICSPTSPPQCGTPFLLLTLLECTHMPHITWHIFCAGLTAIYHPHNLTCHPHNRGFTVM